MDAPLAGYKSTSNFDADKSHLQASKLCLHNIHKEMGLKPYLPSILCHTTKVSSLGQSVVNLKGSALDLDNELPRFKETSLTSVHTWRDIRRLILNLSSIWFTQVTVVIASAVLMWVRRVFSALALELLKVGLCAFHH